MVHAGRRLCARLWRAAATTARTSGAHRFATDINLAAAARALSGSDCGAGAAAVELVDGVHPVIDVTTIVNRGGSGDGGAARSATLAAMAAALKDRGYFYARGVEALPADFIDGIYDYSERAHALPVAVKRRYVASGAYTGPDAGKAELDYEVGTVATVRAWDYSRTRFTLAANDAGGETDLTAAETDPAAAAEAERFPPAEVLDPAYVEVLDDLYERQNSLALGLMTGFADMLGLPSATFRRMFEGGPPAEPPTPGDPHPANQAQGDFGTIRLLSYPGNPDMTVADAKSSSVGISPHTDFEVFTLMHQSAPGLQFIPAGGDGWVDAPVRPGEFVVIVGDILERLTNGVLRATPHRVVVTPHPRASIIRFNAVSPETVVAPLSEFVTADRPAAYGWVTMRTHMETTMRNLEAGHGAWDPVTNKSTTAGYQYVDGMDHRVVAK